MSVQTATTSLLIDGFPLAYTGDDIARLVSSYGTVTNVVIVRDPAGRSLRFGYVTMTTEAEIHAAIAALNGRVITANP